MYFFDKHFDKVFRFSSICGYDNESAYEKFSGRYGRYIRMVDSAYSTKDVIDAMSGASDVYNRYKDTYELGLFNGYAFAKYKEVKEVEDVHNEFIL